jgi:Peptidase family M28
LDWPSSPGLRRILSSAVILAAILAISILAEQPPAPKPSSAPPGTFSAERAIDTLRRILKEDVPHPTGSPANEVVRQRILDEFTRLGYQPQTQTTFACSQYSSCSTVNNVVARLDGNGEKGAVLLAAHYDSVPAGPGDSDDGTGVATVLEIARALKSLPSGRHPVIFLLDEGEEDGLLGAEGFVDSHPWASEVRVAVNVDNRGTHGKSFMFETGRANDWAVRFYARHVRRPAADSISYAVYKLLPNDTDFTVFKRASYQGWNFSYIQGVNQYHTPLDDSAHVSARSVQDHGDQILPLVAALADADLENTPPPRDAVYFTIFGRWMVYWPARRSALWAWLWLFLLAAQVAWLISVGRLSPHELLWAVLAFLVMILVTAAAALVIERMVHIAGVTPVQWIAYPMPLEISFVLIAMVVVVTNAMLFSRRAHFWGMWCGIWAGWSLLAVAISLKAPEISHTVLVPTGVAACAGLPATLRRTENALASSLAVMLPLAAAGILLMGLLIEMYDALGVPALVPIAVLAALLFTPAGPVCGDITALRALRRLTVPWIPALLLAPVLFAAMVAPVYSAKSPERVNFRYVEDADSGIAKWVVDTESGRLPEPIRLAANFHRTDRGYFPWDSNPAFVADAPHRDLAPPTFTILESDQNGGRRTYRALLRSERGASAASVLFPPGSDVESVGMGGIALPPQAERMRTRLHNWFAYSCPALPAAGVELSFSVPLGKTIEVFAVDENYDLPPEGAFLLHARPLTATPSQSGDVTMVARRVQLLP